MAKKKTKKAKATVRKPVKRKKRCRAANGSNAPCNNEPKPKPVTLINCMVDLAEAQDDLRNLNNRLGDIGNKVMKLIAGD